MKLDNSTLLVSCVIYTKMIMRRVWMLVGYKDIQTMLVGYRDILLHAKIVNG